MTTKVKIKPIAIGALAGAGVGFAASKMMGKKKVPFIIGGAVLGALVGHFVGKRGEKKSGFDGRGGKTNRQVLTFAEKCKQDGGTIMYDPIPGTDGVTQRCARKTSGK